MPINANRTAMKASAAEGVAKSRGVGCHELASCSPCCIVAAHTSCIDPPKIIITLWFATSFGFLIRSAANVRWNSAKLRIIALADMIAMVAGVRDSLKI